MERIKQSALRVNYESNLMKSFFIGIGSLTIIAIIFFLFNRNAASDKPKFKETTILTFTDKFILEPETHETIQPVRTMKKIQTLPPPVPPVDPFSFKLVKLVIEPIVLPIAPPVPPEPVEQVAGSGIGLVDVIPPSSGIGNGTGNLFSQTVNNIALVDKPPMFLTNQCLKIQSRASV